MLIVTVFYPISPFNIFQDSLKEVLLELPQFRKKEDLIQMYVAYEFPQ